MNMEKLSSRYQILHYRRELTQMNSLINLMDLGWPSARSHTFENIRDLRGAIIKMNVWKLISQGQVKIGELKEGFRYIY